MITIVMLIIVTHIIHKSPVDCNDPVDEPVNVNPTRAALPKSVAQSRRGVVLAGVGAIGAVAAVKFRACRCVASASTPESEVTALMASSHLRRRYDPPVSLVDSGK